ncbi:MAG: virulence factor [Nocardioidaceae bacterium]
MTEYQVTSWRELPSLVVARNGDEIVKTPMPGRFQEAIDETAMRLGETSSEAYLEGWVRTEWLPADGTPIEVCDRVVADLEARWSDESISAFLAAL